jgi:PII-like signaling protein
VIDIVDAREKIDAFLPLVEEMVGHGLVTLEDVEVIHYGAAGGAAGDVG